MTVVNMEQILSDSFLNTVRERLRSRLLNKSFCHASPEELWVGLCCVYHHQEFHSTHTCCWKVLPGCTGFSASHLLSICGYRARKISLTTPGVCLVQQAMPWPLETTYFPFITLSVVLKHLFCFVSYRTDSWQLVQTHCLPSSSNSIGCSPFQFHEATIYNSVNSSMWRRITIQLPDHVSSR